MYGILSVVLWCEASERYIVLFSIRWILENEIKVINKNYRFGVQLRKATMIQPDYPSAMGLLAHLNSDELKELLNDDSKFDETVLKDVKQVITIYPLSTSIYLQHATY